VFVGRLVTTKGARLLLDAAFLLKNQHRLFQLIIVGDGPERAALENHARELSLLEQVQFSGRLPQWQVNALLNGAQIVVVPSLGGEVFGMVVAENMLRGFPVVASDYWAVPEKPSGQEMPRIWPFASRSSLTIQGQPGDWAKPHIRGCSIFLV
jgi:glycosyltransferase involved in cell wall biosynthesis